MRGVRGATPVHELCTDMMGVDFCSQMADCEKQAAQCAMTCGLCESDTGCADRIPHYFCAFYAPHECSLALARRDCARSCGLCAAPAAAPRCVDAFPSVCAGVAERQRSGVGCTQQEETLCPNACGSCADGGGTEGPKA